MQIGSLVMGTRMKNNNIPKFYFHKYIIINNFKNHHMSNIIKLDILKYFIKIILLIKIIKIKF